MMNTTPVRSPARIKAKQVGGVPHAHLIALVPFSIPDSAQQVIAGGTGLLLGTLFTDDGTVTYNQVPLPKMHGVRLIVSVEVTDYSDDDADTMVSLTLRYAGKDGNARGQYTHPIKADGGVVAFEVPTDDVEHERMLPLSIGVALCSFNGDAKRPVLVRGAWLGFPEAV